jgi:ubiquinone/menaquinone biosynthesis C-methylase UbiE
VDRTVVTACSGDPALVTAPLRRDPAHEAYRGAAASWSRDASAAYAPMAQHLIARSPIELAGALVLDAGAGTGAASAALVAAKARVIAVDLEASMVAFDQDRRPPGLVADVTALPLAGGSFDLVVAAFVLNHLDDVAGGLRELARVTAPGGAVLASTFSNHRATAKSTLDDVAAGYGWSAPDWYRALKLRQSAIGTPRRLRQAARRAGFGDVIVTEEQLDLRIDDAGTIVRYRLGMPQFAGFLSRLGEPRRGQFVRDATSAVAAEGPFRPEVIELVARVS